MAVAAALFHSLHPCLPRPGECSERFPQMTPTLGFAHFTVAYWCVLIAALLPIFCAAIAKFGKVATVGGGDGFDNANPRAWLARQTGWRARANAAQANSFEGLPFFIGAVIIAQVLNAPQVRVDVLAFMYVVLRLLYIMMYVSDLPKARSLVWTLAFFANVGILLAGYR